MDITGTQRARMLDELIREQRELVVQRGRDLAEAQERHTVRSLRLSILEKHNLVDLQDETEIDGLLEVMNAAERELASQERILAALLAERAHA